MTISRLSVKPNSDGCELLFQIDDNYTTIVLNKSHIDFLVKNLLPISDIPTQIQDIIDDVSFKTQMILKGKYER